MRILGIDPGGTTGFAEFYLPKDRPLKMTKSYEVPDFQTQCEYMEDWINIADAIDLVICERFVSRNTPFAPDSPSACEPIGVIKRLAYVNNIPLELPIPSERLAVANEVLKKSDYWIKGMEHARQATRHVLAYVTGILKHSPTLKALHPR